MLPSNWMFCGVIGSMAGLYWREKPNWSVFSIAAKSCQHNKVRPWSCCCCDPTRHPKEKFRQVHRWTNKPSLSLHFSVAVFTFLSFFVFYCLFDILFLLSPVLCSLCSYLNGLFWRQKQVCVCVYSCAHTCACLYKHMCKWTSGGLHTLTGPTVWHMCCGPDGIAPLLWRGGMATTQAFKQTHADRQTTINHRNTHTHTHKTMCNLINVNTCKRKFRWFWI